MLDQESDEKFDYKVRKDDVIKFGRLAFRVVKLVNGKPPNEN